MSCKNWMKFNCQPFFFSITKKYLNSMLYPFLLVFEHRASHSLQTQHPALFPLRTQHPAQLPLPPSNLSLPPVQVSCLVLYCPDFQNAAWVVRDNLMHPLYENFAPSLFLNFLTYKKYWCWPWKYNRLNHDGNSSVEQTIWIIYECAYHIIQITKT